MRRSKSNLRHCDFSQWFLMNKNNCRFVDKRCLSAEDYSLLSSALRPRLLDKNSGNITFRDRIRVKIASNYTKNQQKSSFFTKFDAILTKNIHFFAILTLFFGIFAIFNIFSYNDTSAASLELTVPANFNIDLDPGVGTTFGESTNQQISIKTSGSFGYTLNIKPSDGTDLKNGENLIKTITKSEGYDNSDEYRNSNETNTWAYKPSKLNSLDNAKYLPFPSVETLLDKTDTNNDTANNYDLAIAAKVDNTLPSGKYSNNFVISATANTVSYSITYNLNSGTWNGVSPQTGAITENKIKLDSNKPTRENYEFLGWCSTQTTNETCNGDTKQPGDEITLTNSDNQFTFHAIWKQAIPTTMQEFGNYCGKMLINQTLTLRDTRDNNSYTVAKLLDGKCWMTQNLRIAGITANPSDSDVSSSFYIPESSSSSNFNATQDRQQNNENYVVVHEDIRCGGNYTWYAATAGTGKASTRSSDAIDSICPKNWALPNNNAINILINFYRSNAANAPANFYHWGQHGNCHPDDSPDGWWWTSTAYSDGYRAGNLYVNSSSLGICVSCSNTGMKSTGNAIRCVSKN